jgi:hypothetical protein
MIQDNGAGWQDKPTVAGLWLASHIHTGVFRIGSISPAEVDKADTWWQSRPFGRWYGPMPIDSRANLGSILEPFFNDEGQYTPQGFPTWYKTVTDLEQMVSAEEWRAVVGYDTWYQVSSLGRVRSMYSPKQLDGWVGGLVLEPTDGPDDFKQVRLSAPGEESVPRLLHELVCEAFHDHIFPDDVAFHQSGDKFDNRACNLAWKPGKELVAEVWLGVTDFSDWFQVSNLGNIRSVSRWVALENYDDGAKEWVYGHLTPQTVDHNGRKIVSLGEDVPDNDVAYIVCEAFHGYQPDGTVLSHKSGDITDNRAENLEWEAKGFSPVEEWRPVVGYEDDYDVSNLGRVRDLGEVLTQWVDSNGVARVDILDSSLAVATIVCEAFHGPKPRYDSVVHRLSSDKNDNRADWLEWSWVGP